VGGFAGGGIGGGGDTVAGYKGGGEDGRGGGTRKFCATFRVYESAFSFANTGLFIIILLGLTGADVHSISGTNNRTEIIKFFFIIPSFFIIRLLGY